MIKTKIIHQKCFSKFIFVSNLFYMRFLFDFEFGFELEFELFLVLKYGLSSPDFIFGCILEYGLGGSRLVLDIF